MQVIIYAGISLDGFVAKTDGDSDWVNDDISFHAAVSDAGCIVVGQKSFSQCVGEIYPMPDAYNYVLTNSPKKFKNQWENVEFTNASPEQLIQAAKTKGFEKVVIVGGAQTYTHFLNSGLVTHVTVDIHPLILGAGMKLFSGDKDLGSFELIASQPIENGLIQLQYKLK